MKRPICLLLLLCLALPALAPAEAPAPVTLYGRPEDTRDMTARFGYELISVHAVDGRQGVARGEGGYWVSGSATLSRYDPDWNLIAVNDRPFEGFTPEVNHIGDIDVYGGELYAGVEWFMDGAAVNIRIAVYDAETLTLKRSFPFEPSSGQDECSGIAVDADRGLVWMCAWTDGESGRYLYRYDLESGAYLGKVHLQPVPQWVQGIACHDGCIFLTADDGTADLGEPDHLYRVILDPTGTYGTVILERTFDDVTLQGEIEGLSFDPERGTLLVCCNRGARIVLGMPQGFYEGYGAEVHEVYEFRLTR